MTDTAEPTTLSRGRPPHATSEARKARIFELNAEGKTGVEIARELGITPAAVCYHLQKARNADSCEE